MSKKSLNNKASCFLNLESIFKCFLLILPICLYFSYYPVISLGESESMYFELSVSLLWLVGFDMLAVILMIKQKVLFNNWKNWWIWLLFPVWLTISMFWSLNLVRCLLTVGILWLIYIAIYGMWRLRGLFDESFRQKWWKWFFGSTLVVCVWCFIQCILDLVGVPEECSLLCQGCTYHMFGFPHPNGFSIEPQFMGNLLLAPTLIMAWLYLKEQANKNLERLCSRGIGFFIITSTLFLTFSRGAIYAFVVGMTVMSVMTMVRNKGKVRKNVVKRVGTVWLVVVGAFLFTLNLQGIMAQVSRTNDSYVTGVTKVLNHLSLGVIDIRGDEGNNSAIIDSVGDNVTVENSVENLVEDYVEKDREEALFDGYVAESTDTRVRLTNAALRVWSSSFTTALFGVGLGGAGTALYNNELSPAPREIVQNEYVSLLLETGLIGVILVVFLLIIIVKIIIKNQMGEMLIPLLVAYGVTLFFFSGLPNALQIYLMPAALMVITCKRVKVGLN